MELQRAGKSSPRGGGKRKAGGSFVGGVRRSSSERGRQGGAE
eukprot:CAMPEP_0198439396 /NCGR_PEP_ID=MMETSP1452-20131203/54842_1 /TAXON_ID=1181717 /ORGANISM="Synchroma pusillum, Strain CCMP3072" /LENGTH=41 /DNA_ID= /DNA_START= /DNA_END= /DNA_ORIENTATION=